MDVCPSGYMNELKFSYYPRSDYVNYLRMGTRQNSCSYTRINSIFSYYSQTLSKNFKYILVYTFILMKVFVYDNIQYGLILFYYQILYKFVFYHKKLKMYEAKNRKRYSKFYVKICVMLP